VLVANDEERLHTLQRQRYETSIIMVRTRVVYESGDAS